MATSSEALKSFRKAGVVVFANTKTDGAALPSGARAVRSKAGNTIPMVFVTSADGSTGLDAVTYAAMKSDMRDAVRDLRKRLEGVDVLAAGSGETPTASEEEPELKSESENAAAAQDWVNSEGTTITAAVKDVSDEEIIFIMPDGSEIPYPIAKLSSASQLKAREIAAQ